MTNREIARLIDEGLARHREGDPIRAGTCYEQVLSTRPHHARALHLLGLVMHQLGDHASASRAIARALAHRPNEPHAHANLGEVLRAEGRTRLAIGSRALARRLDPDLFGPARDVDILLRPSPDLDETPGAFEGPSPVVPEGVKVHVDLAIEARSRGDRAGAVDRDRLALSLAPGVGELHGNLCQSLLEAGRLDEALFHGEEATRLAPSSAHARNNLGSVLRALGRRVEAKEAYLHALRLDPDFSNAYNNLGLVLLAEGNPEEATAWFRIGLGLAPESAALRSNLASAWNELGRSEDAVALCEEGLALDPGSADVRIALGAIYQDRGQFEAAADQVRRAVEADPGHAGARLSLGVVHAEAGEVEEAERAFRSLLGPDRGRARVLYELASILKGKLPEADLAAIDRSLEDPSTSDFDRMELHFAAGQVRDARGEFDRSAGHFRIANRIQEAERGREGFQYLPEYHDALVDDVISGFTADFFGRREGSGSSSERPVFVFGLPRSGTTLTAQILASHSRAHGAGELKFGLRHFEALVGAMDSATGPARPGDLLDDREIARMARDYLDRIDEIEREADRVVDKFPENYLHLGLLVALFPKARFIHCRRDLRDVAVSCWSTYFRDIAWANDPDHIAARFESYRRLFDHWGRALPAPVLVVDYEETVADPEAAARRLVDWCGLDWEPACLEFHRSRGVVRTASRTQVREPIYRRSVGRWRNYEAELGPIFSRLACSG